MIFPARSAAAAVAALTACMAAAPASGQSHVPPVSVTCVNPASGTTWQISIDYDRATVDANPADVSEGEISWRDANDGWRYTLDRKTGALTVVVASSTGGYFLHDRCRLPPG